MSIIVAIKENGVVYMGADSQTTVGTTKYNGLNQTAFKVTRLENGMLVGFCGKVSATHTILSMEDVFVLDEQGGLTKRHIVNHIIPKLVEIMGLIGDEDSGEISVGMLLAYKDKLYKITDELDVISLNENGRIGSGISLGNLYLFERKDLPVKERIVKALAAVARRTESVSGPYVLIDTQNCEYEIVDMGGENF